MTKSNVTLVIAILAMVIALGVAITGGSSTTDTKLGGTVEYIKKSFVEGLFAGNNRQVEIQNDGDISTSGDLTVSGGNLTLTTSNSATSSLIVGCVQSYPTSTATAVVYKLYAAATSTFSGTVYWNYGSCPQ